MNRVLRGLLIVSVGVGLVTAPLIAGRMHIFAWTSPIASAVLLPMAFALTLLGMVQVALGGISPGVDWLLAKYATKRGKTMALKRPRWIAGRC